MGSAYYITIDSFNPPFDPFTNGKALAYESSKVDQVAQQNGLKTFNEFQSYSEAFIQDLMEETGLEEPPEWWEGEQWFTASEGIAWINNLIKVVESESATFQQPGIIISELREYEAVFSKCENAGFKWHLSLDF